MAAATFGFWTRGSSAAKLYLELDQARRAIGCERSEAPQQSKHLTTRGLEPAIGYYSLLDRTPIGRNEEGQVFWVRRHEEYEDA